MSESTSSLEREAEETRARIAETADTLRAKMTPGQMVDEFTSIFRGGDTQTALVNLKNQVRDNPLPLALVGAGLAWLAIGKGTSVSTSSRDYDRNDLRDYPARSYPAAGYESDDRDFGDTDYAGSTYGASGSTYRSGSSDYEPGASGSHDGPGIVERATGAASDAWDSTTGAVSDAASAVGEKLSGVGSSTAQAGSRAARGAADYGSRAARGTADFGSRTARGASQKAQGVADSVSDLFNREPLATAVVGLAIGALIGTLLPRTQTEDEQLGKLSDNLKEQAKNLASEGLDHAKEVATETYAAAKSEAEKQGLNPAGVEVGDLHLADRVSSVIKSAARAGEEAARDRLGSGSSDEDQSETSDDTQSNDGSKPTQGSQF